MAKKHKKRVPDYSEIRHAEEAAKMKPAAAADGRSAAAAGAAGDNRPPRLTGGEQKTQRPLAGEQKIDWAAYQEHRQNPLHRTQRLFQAAANLRKRQKVRR